MHDDSLRPALIMSIPSRNLPIPKFLLLMVGCLTAAAWACSVPVFRYALEHWEADPFQAIIFHRSALSAQQQSQIQALRSKADDPVRPNISVTHVDVASEMSPELLDVWKQQAQATALPQLVLRFPRSSGLNTTITTAALADAERLHLTNSPARQEIVERLGDGQCAVWVMLDSGDAVRDGATAKLLQDRLDYLMSIMSLPELDQLDIANGLVSVSQGDLRLEFSLLRISRNDAAENTFTQMLLSTEPDLAAVREPIVFPIFGRGRALYALVGKGIQAETIEQAATFLIGKCSCQVKEQNPGTDLLLTADWNALAKASPLQKRELPSLAHLAQAAAPITVTTQPQAASVSKKGLSPRLVLLLIIAILGAGLVVKKIL